MVESGTAKAAAMTRRLRAENRWAVSGTPMGRGRLADLHGLMAFLQLDCWGDRAWWSYAIEQPLTALAARAPPCAHVAQLEAVGARSARPAAAAGGDAHAALLVHRAPLLRPAARRDARHRAQGARPPRQAGADQGGHREGQRGGRRRRARAHQPFRAERAAPAAGVLPPAARPGVEKGPAAGRRGRQRRARQPDEHARDPRQADRGGEEQVRGGAAEAPHEPDRPRRHGEHAGAIRGGGRAVRRGPPPRAGEPAARARRDEHRREPCGAARLRRPRRRVPPAAADRPPHMGTRAPRRAGDGGRRPSHLPRPRERVADAHGRRVAPYRAEQAAPPVGASLPLPAERARDAAEVHARRGERLRQLRRLRRGLHVRGRAAGRAAGERAATAGGGGRGRCSVVGCRDGRRRRRWLAAVWVLPAVQEQAVSAAHPFMAPASAARWW